MTLLLAAALNTVAVAVGTFAANFYILWIIGKKAQAVQDEQNKLILKLQEEALQRIQLERERMKKYAEMES